MGKKTKEVHQSERSIRVGVNDPVFRTIVKGMLPKGLPDGTETPFMNYFKEGNRLNQCVARIQLCQEAIQPFFPPDKEEFSKAKFETGLVQLLTNRDVLQSQIISYFVATLQAESSFKKIEPLRKDAEQKMTQFHISPSSQLQQVLDEIETTRKERTKYELLHNAILINDLLNNLTNTNRQLSDENRQMIDQIFTYTGDKKQMMDIAILFTFAQADTPNAQDAKSRGYSENIAPQVENIWNNLQAYIKFYWQYCLQRAFKGNGENGLIPNAETSLLPLFLAAEFTSTISEMLPANFEGLLQGGLVSNIPLHVVDVCAEKYKADFEKQNKYLEKIKAMGVYPYVLAESTHKNGTRKLVLDELSQNDFIENISSIPDTNSLQTFLKNYSKICKYIRKDIEIIDLPTDDFFLGVATHGENNFIDLIVLSPANETVILQIDRHGRLVGIPTDYTGDITKLTNFIIKRAVGHFKDIEVIKEDQKIEETKAVTSSLLNIVWDTPIQNEPDRIATQYTSDKKKNGRRLGGRIQDIELKEEVPDNSTQSSDQPLIALSISEELIHDQGLSLDQQKELTEIVRQKLDTHNVKRLKMDRTTLTIRQGRRRILVKINENDSLEIIDNGGRGKIYINHERRIRN